jgi:HD-like signal output (HDOD) protein
MAATTTPEALSRAQTLHCLDKLPKLSPLMTQLLARLARRNCDLKELNSIIEKDALLSAQVLRLANSAAFGRAQPIHSVKHAIAMLGVGCIRKFALGASLANLFSRRPSTPAFSIVRFNLHSVATATLVELLTDEIPIRFASGAFVAGLLHDVGSLIIAVSMPVQYDTILSMAAVTGDSILECERQVLGTDHAELGALAIVRWDLAEPITWAAYYHHAPDQEPVNKPPERGGLSLSAAVQKVDDFVDYLGMSILPARPQTQEAPALEFPGFPFSQERLLKRFEIEWKGMGDLFQ